MQTTQVVDKPVERKAIKLGEFHGAFARFQTSCYYDLIAAGLTEQTSHKIAGDYGSDIGNAIRNAADDGLTSKIGKAKKNGDTRISISGGGLTKTSRTMSIYRVAQQLDNLYREGLLASRKLDTETLSKVLREYLDECSEWCAVQTFEN